MNSLNRTILGATTAWCLLLAGCGDSTSPEEGFVIRGTIQNNTQTAIPAGARLLVAWAVVTGTEHTYVFGEGTLNRRNGTFKITLPDPPPADALNANAVGIGLIVATTNAGISTGGDIQLADLIGAAGAYAIIYVADTAQAETLWAWTGDFESGYEVGQGQTVQGSFDVFVPTDPEDVVLTIDDLSSIDFVNWS